MNTKSNNLGDVDVIDINERIRRAPTGDTHLIHLERNSEGQVINERRVTLSEDKMVENGLANNFKGYDPFRRLTEVRLQDGRNAKIALSEALNQPDAAEMLRSGIRYLAFSRFAQMPRTFEGIVTFSTSNKPQEEYLRDSAVGAIPFAPSGQEAPKLLTQFEGGVTVVNKLYRGQFSLNMDWIRFDNIGKIRQFADILGRALRMTEEDAVYSTLTTVGNYTRSATAKDNDVGANTSALTFSGLGLETALATISTSKDRHSGSYLGYKADTIVIGPRMEVAVKQLLMSSDLHRQHGNTTAEVRGTGGYNEYKNMINKIIVSPWFPTGTNGYQWLVFDSSVQWCQFQEVEAPNVYQQAAEPSNSNWFNYDSLGWLAMCYFGVGIVDDRAAFYSSSTTAPTVS
jgi:hypothetical protein